MEKKIALKTISAKDLWAVLKRCYLLVIVAAVLVTTVLYVRAKNSYSPVYSSTAVVVLIGENDGAFDKGEFADEYNIANRIVNDCNYLIKSRRVLNAAGEDVGIKNGYAALVGRVTVENPEETRIFNITAIGSSPEQAKTIADSVAKNGIKEIQHVFAYDQLRVFEEGNLSAAPINGFSFTTYAVYGAIAAIGVYAVFLLMFLFDTYIHTAEDVEHYLGLSVLGDIPRAGSKKRGYHAYKMGTPMERFLGKFKKKDDSDGKKG